MAFVSAHQRDRVFNLDIFRLIRRSLARAVGGGGGAVLLLAVSRQSASIKYQLFS